MPVTPYLFFNGRCEEAIGFYKEALGAEVDMMMRFKEAPPPPEGANQEEYAIPPGTEDKVMHACFRINDTSIMASDGGCGGETAKFSGFSLSLNAKDEADADRLFSALAEGGKVEQPLMETFFAKRFGTVADRFGVGWMVIVPAEGMA